MKFIIAVALTLFLSILYFSLSTKKEIDDFVDVDESLTTQIKTPEKRKIIIEDFDDFNRPSNSSASEEGVSLNDNHLSSLNLSPEEEMELQNQSDHFKNINNQKDEIESSASLELEDLKRIEVEELNCSSKEECLNQLNELFLDQNKKINAQEINIILPELKKEQIILFEKNKQKIEQRFHSNI